jgi:hypothetical protein
MISPVVPFTDRALFAAMAGYSLERQRPRVEILAIDNSRSVFSCAADVLNTAAEQVSGEWLMFAHQDVSFEGDSWLADAEAWLRTLGDAGIAGIAGARGPATNRTCVVLSNISDSVPPQRDGFTQIDAPEPVQTLDECLFFVKRSLVRRVSFDRMTCRGWHLYAVEYCLTLGALGCGVYVLPLDIYHRSGGRRVASKWFPRYEDDYYRTLSAVLRKHRRQFPVVYTTCGTWRADRPLFWQKYDRVAAWTRLRSELGLGASRTP